MGLEWMDSVWVCILCDLFHVAVIGNGMKGNVYLYINIEGE